MKKSCRYCGGIHESGYICPDKPQKKYPQKRDSAADKFRSSYGWQQKRTHILRRDYYLCRVCFSNGTANAGRLSVHHIVPVKNNFSLRLDDDNLITLCAVHHEQAEKGRITADELRRLIPPTSERS